MEYLILSLPILLIIYLFINPLLNKKMGIQRRPIISNVGTTGTQPVEGVKKYFRKPQVDTFDAIQFDGTNQNEISTFTNSQIIPIEGENIMKDTYEYANLTYLYEGNYVCHHSGNFYIMPKREFEEKHAQYEG